MSGMRGVNPRQMKQAMRKMGITNRTIDNVTEVIIRTPEKDIVITNPDVNVMTMQGVDNYQITGEVVERAPGETSAAPVASFPAEDIELVMSQTNCDREKAIAALEACDGQPAEAILKIMTE
ncbi:MAG: nascent polypeptide-associated complex protein [Candidatus Methanomethylophilaceae archaeon]|nr:nascent polypeptide-associated complex protein [Candidatus Methanomethylophilaceae archaeon]